MAKKQIDNDGPGRMPTVNDFRNWFVDLMDELKADLKIDWFLGLVEPHQKEEAPRTSAVGGKRIWVWPYMARMEMLLRKYLSCDETFKQIIIGARADGIFWRGDDQEFFINVINETERMRKIGAAVYIEECLAKRKVFMRVDNSHDDDEAKTEK